MAGMDIFLAEFIMFGRINFVLYFTLIEFIMLGLCLVITDDFFFAVTA